MISHSLLLRIKSRGCTKQCRNLVMRLTSMRCAALFVTTTAGKPSLDCVNCATAARVRLDPQAVMIPCLVDLPSIWSALTENIDSSVLFSCDPMQKTSLPHLRGLTWLRVFCSPTRKWCGCCCGSRIFLEQQRQRRKQS